jgi:porin
MRVATLVGLGLLLLLQARPAGAQPYDVPSTWGGDVWSRPRLTGSWFGVRDELGQKGVVLDVDLLLTPQSVMTGGLDTGSCGSRPAIPSAASACSSRSAPRTAS